MVFFISHALTFLSAFEIYADSLPNFLIAEYFRIIVLFLRSHPGPPAAVKTRLGFCQVTTVRGARELTVVEVIAATTYDGWRCA
jgi:hypothetical protein